MAWIAKHKKIELTSVTGHSHRPIPGVIGRAPGIRQIQFSPLELFGAMARCSHLHPINPDAVTFESESCRHLIAHHVDERPDEFSLLASAKRLKDFSRSHLVGVVGAGVAYLQMIRDGYVWCDHFENQLLLETALTKRSPDFVFSRPDNADVAITESKATHGSSRKQFGRSVENGYVEQVEPYLGMQISGATVSHGFAIGSWMTSPTRAELVIDHTAVPVLATPPDDVPSNPTAVKRGNYLTVLALMFGSAAARGARDGTWPSPGTVFVVADWLGRQWIIASNNPVQPATVGIEERFLDTGSADPAILQTNVFALERNIANVVLRSLVGAGEAADALATLDPIVDGPYASARASGGAIYPDGFSVIGRAESLENVHVLGRDPNGHRIGDHDKTVVESWHLDESLEQSTQPLQITIRTAD
ncbi:hypothetical protein JQ634_00985 [Bradyrhizobium sp. AUGA SZCCT0240]|uniref:hypothetical protein n=1 Tax=Bradyrhizobium sp. AUGA SZCCT0240 TaxID=2807669 RepID=UPI001BAC78FF|nr:hypothetical protein [Bradyrhizobium sp. AUGA SZCCT0240]MBR1252272.1 hypothetical protein [Bradyrhizobium sp. AUGA SZCCT0240]